MKNKVNNTPYFLPCKKRGATIEAFKNMGIVMCEKCDYVVNTKNI